MFPLLTGDGLEGRQEEEPGLRGLGLWTESPRE